MTWEDATQLAERIAKSPDAGTLHVAVIVAPEGQGHAVVIRQHGRHELHYLQSMDEFKALCEWLLAPRSGYIEPRSSYERAKSLSAIRVDIQARWVYYHKV